MREVENEPEDNQPEEIVRVKKPKVPATEAVSLKRRDECLTCGIKRSEFLKLRKNQLTPELKAWLERYRTQVLSMFDEAKKTGEPAQVSAAKMFVEAFDTVYPETFEDPLKA